jgi:hypothetical protein
MPKEKKMTEEQKRLLKIEVAKCEARIQSIRKTQGGEGVKPTVTLPKFSWDKKGEYGYD